MAAVNNNSSTVIIGRTAPVPAGQQTSAKSIPVVIASDQSAIPVEEQNKQQSEVALSLLGIPRSEVALGIFADVNTYDVNPTEWTAYPEQFTSLAQYQPGGNILLEKYSGYGGDQDWGLTHIAEEAGAMIEAPSDEYSILTSKRFFRYQPGRVSAATFGVKLNRGPYTITANDPAFKAVRNPTIKKYGIFDKFDGYYFESKNDGYGDNFSVVRRTQSIIRDNPLPFSTTAGYQTEDYAWVGVAQVESNAPTYSNAYDILKANKRFLQEVAANFIGTEGQGAETLDGPDVIDGGTGPSYYTPTAATYTPATGELSLTIGAHSHEVGDTVLLEPNSLSFTCTSDGNQVAKSYPRASGDDGTQYGAGDNRGEPDPAYNKDLKILAVTGTTITINVGISSDTAAHNFTGASADAVAIYSTQNAEWDKCRRDAGLVIEGLLHDLKYGGNASTVYNTYRFFNKTDLDNIRLYVDDSSQEVLRYTAIRKAISDILGRSTVQYFTPGAGTSYDPATGDLELSIGSHSLVPGLRVQLAANSLIFTCDTDPSKPKSYPRATGEDGSLVTPGANNNIGNPDPAYNRAIEITAVTGTTITVNVGISSDTAAHQFVSADTNAVKAYRPTYYTPTNTGSTTAYDPATGLLTLTIGNHSIEAGSSILLQPNSLSFTCTSDGNQVAKSYPRASGDDGTQYGAGDNTGRPDPAYKRGIRVESVTATSITINVGISSDTAAHTFTAAASNAVIAYAPTAPYYSDLKGYDAYAGATNTLPISEQGAYDAAASLLSILTTALTGAGNYSSIPSPTGSAAGEMCVYRDGLVMTHGAAHDPSLLLEKVDYAVTDLINDGINNWLRIKIPSGASVLQVGQNFYFNKNGNTADNIVSTDADNLSDGSIWHVHSIRDMISNSSGVFQDIRLSKYPNNEEIYTTVGEGSTASPSNPWGNNEDKAYPDVEEFVIDTAANITTAGYSLQTPTPFLLPDDARAYKGQNYSDDSLNDNPTAYVDGAFPYLYPSGASGDPNSVGYIDTTLQGSGGIPTLKQQINYVNKRLYKNWCWFNVDPKYYKVYEYRVPRSRMSGEKLNGVITDVVYSDNVLDKRAGDPVLEPTTQEQIEFESVWDLDPTKVTMYKVEFSWYGAVGATFLAYVPVENNEARWVRVHHLRASNQLKVASLGNATLPITYMVYGGGSKNRHGYQNTDRLANTESGYGSFSEQLVKYGASYYIDGGDRGTVRLFSYASETLKEIGGSKYLISGNALDNPNLFDYTNGSKLNPNPGTSYINAFALKIDNTGIAPPVSDYYINARVVTGNANDQDVRVIWARPAESTTYAGPKISNTAINSYDPNTGLLTLDIGEHNHQVGDRVLIEEEALGFTCGLDNFASTKYYPRATGSNEPGGADPGYNNELEILSKTSTTITVNVGDSSDTTEHRFVGYNTGVYSTTDTIITVNAGPFLYLSRALSATSGNISLVVDRPQPLIGIKCRREINGVRNRVQIYPTRLATGLTSSSESLVVQLIKSPLFQTLSVPASGSSIGVNASINIGKRGKKVLLPSSEITEYGTYLEEGQSTYGYFRYTVVGDTSGEASTMLGLLEKTGGSYYFSASEVTIDELNIRGSFLRVSNWSGPGDNSDDPDLTATVESPGFNGFFSSTLSRLSAVQIDTEQRSPIPGTGTVVTTLFSPNSGAEFDLQSYFDYNKDYLSFPLTDLVDSLYVCASSKSFYGDSNGTGAYGKRGEILASLTWEEQ